MISSLHSLHNEDTRPMKMTHIPSSLFILDTLKNSIYCVNLISACLKICMEKIIIATRGIIELK